MSLLTHFALLINRLLSSFAFLYTDIGRKGACDLFLLVARGAAEPNPRLPSYPVANASRLVVLLCLPAF